MRIECLILLATCLFACAPTECILPTISTNSGVSPSEGPLLRDRQSLNALLLSRIGPPWDSEVALDIDILAQIGDYRTAKRLVEIIEARDSKMGLRLCACVMTILERRDAEVLRLDAGARKKLSDELVAEIPGGWDILMVANVKLLGEIGDEMAAEKLDALLRDPDTVIGGQIVKPMMEAIRKIRQRTQQHTDPAPSSSASLTPKFTTNN